LSLLKWAAARLKDWFGPELLAGVVVQKAVVPPSPGGSVFVGLPGMASYPLHTPPTPTEYHVTFESGPRRRTVRVDEACFKRYRVGDRISFEKQPIV
jgi:hypothetical protein